MTRHLDEIDRQIIEELQSNARQTNQQLAKKLGIAASTLTRRLQWLEDHDIIKGYTCVVDPSTLGYSTVGYTLVRLSTTARKPIEEIIKRFTDIPEVAEVCKIFGDDDLIVKIYAQDNKHYQDVLENFRSVNTEDGYHTKSMLVSEIVYNGGVADIIKKAQDSKAKASIVEGRGGTKR